jgi:protein TonB
MIAAAWPQMVPRGSPVEVKVRVIIDANGRVTNVVPVQRTAVNYQFVNSAVAAAKVWTFAPAMENGHAVPGESVLTFKFTP